MKYPVTFFAPFMGGQQSVAPVGVKVDGDLASITLRRGECFEEWRDSGMVTTEGTVGDMNRAALHRLVDAWLDGVEFDG